MSTLPVMPPNVSDFQEDVPADENFEDEMELFNLSTLSDNDLLPDELPYQEKVATVCQAKALLAFVYITIIMTSLCANILVIVVITSSRQLRALNVNVFFVSLALSDSLVAAVNMPFQLLFLLHNEWTLGELLCKLSNYLQGVVVVSSILTLTGIAIDRYYAICRPLKARYLHTVRRAVGLISIFWIVSVVLLLPQLLVQRVEPLLIVDVHPQLTVNSRPVASIRVVHVCAEFFPDWRWNVAYTFTYYVVLCIVPVLTMLIAYGHIARTLWFHTTPGELSSSSFDVAAAKRLDERKRVVRMLVIIVSVFAISWFPFFTLQVYWLFDDVPTVNVTSRRTLTACLQLIAYTNCAVNPVIYCLLNQRFKARVKRLATSVKRWGRSEGHLRPATLVAGPPLRLGLLLTRDAGMSVDIPRTLGRRAMGTVGDAHLATNGSEGHTLQTPVHSHHHPDC